MWQPGAGGGKNEDFSFNACKVFNFKVKRIMEMAAGEVIIH